MNYSARMSYAAQLSPQSSAVCLVRVSPNIKAAKQENLLSARRERCERVVRRTVQSGAPHRLPRGAMVRGATATN